jgi:hypothetical protein
MKTSLDNKNENPQTKNDNISALFITIKKETQLKRITLPQG